MQTYFENGVHKFQLGVRKWPEELRCIVAKSVVVVTRSRACHAHIPVLATWKFNSNARKHAARRLRGTWSVPTWFARFQCGYNNCFVCSIIFVVFLKQCIFLIQYAFFCRLLLFVVNYVNCFFFLSDINLIIRINILLMLNLSTKNNLIILT